MATTTDEPQIGQKGAFGRVWDGNKWVREAKSPPTAPVAVEGEVLEAPDEVMRQLAEFASLMGDAVKKKTDTKKVLDQVAELLNSLDPNAYAEVLAHPVVEKLTGAVAEQKMADPGLLPGADLGQAIGKKPWTWSDLAEDKMEWAVYTPRKSQPVTYNGLTYYFQEDVTVRCPKCFVDIAEDSRQQARYAKEHVEYMFRMRDSVSDPTIISDGTQRVRGRHRGGLVSGQFTEVPDQDRPGLGEASEGEDEGDAA